MPAYKSLFISLPDDPEFQSESSPAPFTTDPKHVAQLLTARGVSIAQDAVISSVPRICFTQVTDEKGYSVYRELNQAETLAFHGAITIGPGCFLESNPVTPPFHSSCIKLTSVKANDKPAGKITLGTGVQMLGVAIVAYEHVEIGDYVGIGPGVTIMDCDGHTTEGRGTDTEIARLESAPVKIGANSWIGAGAWIMKGVQIGENCVIGANSVVIKSIPDNTVVMGNPARVVKKVS
ncbi:DapH/DapD/GlmU-related protein [Motilimonas sp. 1_MG-2023]|uniref:acyltransferase n=1 Tax=Motilimonas sp. 1_MG-2023 TaxID=3062672 RepID=UPI0026E17853|nr:DapH/DapD/GlmU-related protein [Motilimonas sp. 1_MG-2023]MDO6525357.1 DapH/DapD/GlmU-related protein [Motilimonas sp. 1_MG-2023]